MQSQRSEGFLHPLVCGAVVHAEPAGRAFFVLPLRLSQAYLSSLGGHS